jgi:hypothetical protein
MTNTIKSLEELRFESEASRIRGLEREAFLKFSTEHPSFALEANLMVFRDFHNGNPMTYETIMESFPVLRAQNRLAEKHIARVETEQVAAEKAEVKRLRSLTTEELKREAYRAQTEIPLPGSITREMILTAEAVDLRKWLNRYGEKMVNMRLQRRG